MYEVRCKNQSGYILLATATMILIGVSITALIVTKSMFFEYKGQSNEYQQRMGFQAAEAGLEYGIGYLYKDPANVLIDNDDDGFIDTLSNASLTNVILPNGSRYYISYSNTNVNSYRTVEVAATGYSNNGESQRTLRQLVTIYPLLVNDPPAGIVAKQDVNLSGSVNIRNTQTDKTIQSGGDVILGGSASTTTSGGGSSSGSIGPDISAHDSSLSSTSGDQFFEAFFGRTKAQAEQSANVVYNNNSDTDMSSTLDQVKGKAIWINQSAGEARFNSNITIGSVEQPVILIVDGPLKMNGNVTVYGIIYVIGDWDNNGGGTLNVNGGIIVEGNLSSTGTPNVNYSQSILDNLSEVGQYVKVPGSWRDF